MKDAHAVPFEVRPPASITSGTVTGCVDFYVGAVLIGQANVEMAVSKPNDSSDATEKPDVLGPVAKVSFGMALEWGKSGNAVGHRASARVGREEIRRKGWGH